MILRCTRCRKLLTADPAKIATSCPLCESGILLWATATERQLREHEEVK